MQNRKDKTHQVVNTKQRTEGDIMQNIGVFGTVIYVVIIIGIFYFMGVRPQQKEKKKQQEMLSSLAVGDTVLTTSGFYGVVIDLTEDTVIVEFGGNKNCRIPMQKAAIVQIEKAN